MEGILITNKMAKTVVLLSYFSDYSPSRNDCAEPKERNERGKKQFAVILCSKLGGIQPCIQSTALCEVFFTRLDQKTRMSSNAGCYITQLDSPHSLIHFSAYLYPFKSGDLTTLYQAKQAYKQG